ncbi:hypothetical protein TNCV_2217321 [Trichonephila clavipes]|nr:hypothetical protein TNCV_2217321 [Trichonephila clavipes]
MKFSWTEFHSSLSLNFIVVLSFLKGRKESCTPVVGCSLEHHTGNRTILLPQFHTYLEGEYPVGVRGLQPLLPFHQPHERTCVSTAIKSTPLPQRHYTGTNIYVFAGIRTQVLRLRSQRH